MTENQIVQGLIKGNDEAVEALINTYGDKLLRTALAITGDRATAEEAVQDTLLQVCRKISSYKGDSSLLTWIFRININIAKNKLRSSWFKKVSLHDPGEALFTNLPFKDQGPEENLLTQERHNEVLECLKILPLKYREVVVLFYIQELTTAELSSILNQSAGTIKSKLSRGRILLKQKLEERGFSF